MRLPSALVLSVLLVSSVSTAAAATASVTGGSYTNCPAQTYKTTKSFIDGLAQMPSTWSYLFAGETALSTQADLHQGLLFSAAQDGVAFGDTNWNQVDFYKMAGSDVTKLMAEYRKNQNPGDHWETLRLRGGATADVVTRGLDNGQVTKGGTGGKTLFLRWSTTQKDSQGITRTYDFGMLVQKQALGDAAFECGTERLLKTFDFGRIRNIYAPQYPVLNK